MATLRGASSFFLHPRLAMNRKSIRQLMRKKRNSLTSAEQRHHARLLRHILSTHPDFRFRRRIALYLPNDGEISPHLITEQLWLRNRQVFLPVLHPLRKNTLYFCCYQATSKLKKNQYGILEPAAPPTSYAAPWTLSAVLMPLVAFDRQGGRLGMGGGYYDRTFAFLHQRTFKKDTVKLFGLAHSVQEYPNLPIESWDVRLTHIATEKFVRRIEEKQKY